MADLTFPQLSSGALVQYPVRKQISLRTIQNISADGSIWAASDPGARRLVWALSYVDLSLNDLAAIQSHFQACSGPLRGFTFLDPTDNLLQYSTTFAQPSWNIPTTMIMQGGFPDPLGGNGAFKVTNSGTAVQQISQTVAAPANYQYCFSIYASLASAPSVHLLRSSANDQQDGLFSVSEAWCRVASNGQLNDSGLGVSVAISIGAGQNIMLFGPQLEPQIAPSRFRPTYSQAGIYANAHWAVQELVITAQGPNLFSASFSIDSIIPD